MKSCEKCVHNRGCIDSVNYKTADKCEKYEEYEELKPCPHCNWDMSIAITLKDAPYLVAICGNCGYEELLCKAKRRVDGIICANRNIELGTKIWNRRADNV